MNESHRPADTQRSTAQAIKEKVGSNLFRHTVTIANIRNDKELAPEKALESMIGSGAPYRMTAAVVAQSPGSVGNSFDALAEIIIGECRNNVIP